MADYITKIRTVDGDKQIDYNALANLPNLNVLNSDQYGTELPDAGTPGRYFLIPSEDLYAPAGYGLGAGSKSVDSVFDITVNGWYVTNGDTPNNAWMICHACVTNNGEDVAVEAWNMSGTQKYKITKHNDTWGEWKTMLVGIGTYTGDLDDYATLMNTVAWVNGANVANAPSTNFGVVETWGNGTGIVIQRFNSVSNTVAMRIRYNGAWKEWEWQNPAMTTGKEYRTTERYNGKPVYAYHGSYTLGEALSGTKKLEIQTGIAGLDTCVRMFSKLGYYHLPYMDGSLTTHIEGISSNYGVITLSNRGTGTWNAGFVLDYSVYYTKTTD